MFRFETLEIWQEGIDCVNSIYKITGCFPKHEIFSLTSQLRRAAVSIAANIAEGSASDSRKDFCRFINFSVRSIAETVALLTIAKKLGYINEIQFNDIYMKLEILIKRVSHFRNNLKD